MRGRIGGSRHGQKTARRVDHFICVGGVAHCLRPAWHPQTHPKEFLREGARRKVNPAAVSILPPRSANRHDTGSRGAGVSGVLQQLVRYVLAADRVVVGVQRPILAPSRDRLR